MQEKGQGDKYQIPLILVFWDRPSQDVGSYNKRKKKETVFLLICKDFVAF